MFDDPHLLTPAAAAKAAEDVYVLRPSGMTIRGAFDGLTQLGPAGRDPNGVGLSSMQSDISRNSDFVVGDRGRFTGVTGMTWGGATPPAFLQSRTGFGFVARGQAGAGRSASSVDRSEDVLIAIRGTEFLSLDDWSTNLTIADELGPGGFRVHAGFHRAYRSMAKEIDALISTGPRTRVHCIGHSLGGAIATLLAADLAENRKSSQIFLYTFGAPRVADANFGNWLTGKLGANRMLRVYHPADPVPMIPLYPYQQPDMAALRVAAPEGSFIIHNYHGMLATYGPAMQRIDGWNALLDNRAAPVNDALLRWYLDVGFNQMPIRTMSAAVMALAVQALQYVLATIRGAMGAALDRQLTRSAHTLDTLAAALVLGLEIDDTISMWVRSLLRTIARLAGKVIEIGQDITRWFIRYLLESLLRMIGQAALKAFQLTFRA